MLMVLSSNFQTENPHNKDCQSTHLLYLMTEPDSLALNPVGSARDLQNLNENLSGTITGWDVKCPRHLCMICTCVRKPSSTINRWFKLCNLLVTIFATMYRRHTIISHGLYICLLFVKKKGYYIGRLQTRKVGQVQYYCSYISSLLQ